MSRQKELLGKKCRSITTGFEGICSTRIIWMFGCDQYMLCNIDKDYKTHYFLENEKTIEVIQNIPEIDEFEEELGRQEEFFGKKCIDKVTGFIGVCTGRRIDIVSVDQYALTPAVKEDGTLPATEWFDEGRIEVIEDTALVEETKASKPGGITFNPEKMYSRKLFSRGM